MRPRAPHFIWLPFVFSVWTISWALLLAGLAILAAVIVTPAIQDVNEATATRNDYQATLDLLDQKIALQKDFLHEAGTNAELMDRLATRQLNRSRPGEKILPLVDPAHPEDQGPVDKSVETLLAESLTPVEPKKAAALPTVLAKTMIPGVRQMLILVACGAMGLSFFLGVRYDRN